MREHDRLIFSLDEYKMRLENVKKEMVNRGIETLIITQPDNIFYLTGHETTGYDVLQALIVPLDGGEPYSLTRFLEQSNMITRSWVEDCHIYLDHEDSAKKLIDLLYETKRDKTKIGYEIEGMFLPLKTRLALEKEFLQNLISGSGVVEKVRRIKSKAELELMQKVADLSVVGMKAGIDATKVGVHEHEIAAAVHEAMYRAGSHYPSVRPYISSGWKTNVGHATWTDKKIENNECVFLELTACLDRYHAPLMRTVFTGKVPQNILDGEKVVLEHLERLKEFMKPGVTASEVDLLTRSEDQLRKIKATRISRIGYGMGISFAPTWDEGNVVSLVQGNQTPLETGMAFHLIPWIQFPDDDAVMTISETVVVTDKGAKSLMPSLALDMVVK